MGDNADLCVVKKKSISQYVIIIIVIIIIMKVWETIFTRIIYFRATSIFVRSYSLFN